jgi:CRP-like cAMP-binding protein
MASPTDSISLLKDVEFFSDISPKHLEQIAGISQVKTFRDGEEIFHEGGAQKFLYFVIEGRVALEIHVPNSGKLRILTVEPNETLGWSSMTDVVRTQTATARVVMDSKLLAVDSAQLRKLCRDDPKLGFIIMERMANTIAKRLMMTRLQLIDMFARPSSEAPHG